MLALVFIYKCIYICSELELYKRKLSILDVWSYNDDHFKKYRVPQDVFRFEIVWCFHAAIVVVAA